jgi:alpha-tubulin suppressor-like RCC1 family protein
MMPLESNLYAYFSLATPRAPDGMQLHTLGVVVKIRASTSSCSRRRGCVRLLMGYLPSAQAPMHTFVPKPCRHIRSHLARSFALLLGVSVGACGIFGVDFNEPPAGPAAKPNPDGGVAADTAASSTGTGTCTAGQSPEACGAACIVCDGPANGNGAPACAAGTCAIQCNPGYATCATGCCKDVPMPAAYRWARLNAGSGYSCATTTAGSVKCWGYGPDGELGNGKVTGSLTPVSVTTLMDPSFAVAGGFTTTCAVTTQGAARCWGSGQSGQLGDAMTSNSSVPRNVEGLSTGVSMIAAGSNHACAVTTAGGVKCWGAGKEGQLGDGTLMNSSVPVDVLSLPTGVQMIAIGSDYSCVVTTAGTAKCWGSGKDGRLGNGTQSDSFAPDIVRGLGSGVSMVASSIFHSCAVTTTGAVKCWGLGIRGALGNGSAATSFIPVDVTGLGSGISMVAVGAGHSCAVTTTGAVKCWGRGVRGELGNGANQDSAIPVNVRGLNTGVLMVAAGNGHSCAITTAGKVYCWGANDTGALGNNSTADSAVPVDVAGF